MRFIPAARAGPQATGKITANLCCRAPLSAAQGDRDNRLPPPSAVLARVEPFGFQGVRDISGNADGLDLGPRLQRVGVSRLDAHAIRAAVRVRSQRPSLNGEDRILLSVIATQCERRFTDAGVLSTVHDKRLSIGSEG